MSKIKNSRLDQYGAEPFEQQQFGTAGVEGVYRFSNFLHCWKAYEICYNTVYDATHLTLGMLLHSPGKFEI